jgi:tryptophan 2,3-dioxygenase
MENDKLLYFDKLFSEDKSHDDKSNDDVPTFSNKALQSALFIMLYRDFPVFQTSYQILDSLIEIDHLMAGWRHKHMVMVRRMIGMRQGTGNTSGAGYLQGALENHFVFKDLEGLSTFLIERKKLPRLPKELIVKLSYVN